MKRSKVIIGLTATALVLPAWGVAQATEPAPGNATRWTELVSDDGGDGGRELPAMSADGKYVVVAGRGANAGIWVKNRAKPRIAAKQVATGDLQNPAISGNGKVVAWAAYGGSRQVWVYNWTDPKASPRIASKDDAGVASTKPSDFPSLSWDGRFVAFQSMDTTLDAQAMPGKAGGGPNKVYVRDMKYGHTEMVSVVDAAGGDQIVNGNAIKPDITPNGRYVVFASDASVLQPAVAEGESTYQQVYLRNRGTQRTKRISINNSWQVGNGMSAGTYGPSVSDDGQRVVFESQATNLVTGDTNEDTDAFMRDRSTNTTTRISVAPGGAQVDTDDTGDTTVTSESGGSGSGGSEEPTETWVDAAPVGMGPQISGNGAQVAFESDAALTPDDTNSVDTYTCSDDSGDYSGIAYVTDIYRYNVSTKGVTRWSVPEPGDANASEAEGYRMDGHTGLCTVANNGVDPAISANGRRIAFVSNGNLTGITASEEEGETTTDPVGVALEPMTYLHRPNPAARDKVRPSSHATSPTSVTTKSFIVKYSTFDRYPSSGIRKVKLFVMRPGASSYKLAMVDRGTKVDHQFTFAYAGVKGKYRFYTVAVDGKYNSERRPGRADTVTARK